MGRGKKNIIIEENNQPKKRVTYEDVKSTYLLPIDRKEYIKFTDIYHYIRPYLDRELKTNKSELLKKFPESNKMVEDVWYCVNDLKLKWPNEMVAIVFDL